MDTTDLKMMIADHVQQAWPQFAAAHPHLSEAMDQLILTNHIAESLIDDRDFQAAIAHAEIVGTAAITLKEWVDRLLDKLIQLRLSPD